MTTFKVGDLVVPKNEEQRKIILSQASYSISFPCRIIDAYGGGPGRLLSFEKSDGRRVALYAYRFSKLPPPNKPLEEYL